MADAPQTLHPQTDVAASDIVSSGGFGPSDRYVCENCNHRMTGNAVLTAPSPFDPQDRICGCPRCFAVNEIRGTCDEPGCWEQDTMGTPTPAGYRRTCWQHRPNAEAQPRPDRRT